MFDKLYSVFHDGEYVCGFDLAPELRRYMNEIYAECNYHTDVMEEWQVLMNVKKGIFW